jgi:hypothetical protein
MCGLRNEKLHSHRGGNRGFKYPHPGLVDCQHFAQSSLLGVSGWGISGKLPSVEPHHRPTGACALETGTLHSSGADRACVGLLARMESRRRRISDVDNASPCSIYLPIAFPLCDFSDRTRAEPLFPHLTPFNQLPHTSCLCPCHVCRTTKPSQLFQRPA